MSSCPIVIGMACALVLGAGCSRAHAQSSARSSSSETSDVRFTGEVVGGKPFERDIGHDLSFVLVPLAGDGGGGWVIEIVPKVQPPDGLVEFSEVATPPYHFYNDRYLAGAYGYSTKEAVEVTMRKFNFVQSVADEHAGDDVVNAALYPSAATDEEKLRIAREAASVHLGNGELRILRSRVVYGKAGQPDAIVWLRFDVALNFSPGLTLADILAPKPPANR